MCTVKGDREIMVCDVSRDRVREALLARLGGAVRAETVHGEGTRFTCVDSARAGEFQACVSEALGWSESGFPDG